MKTRILFAAALVCAAPVWAQPDPIIKPVNGLPFPLVTFAEAERLAILQPIVLRFKSVTVAQALEELQKQSGIELDLENVSYSKKTLAKTIALDVETRSFNQAFDAIMGAAELTALLQRNGDERPLRVEFNRGRSERGEAEAPQSVQGLFALRLSRLNTTFSKTLDITDVRAPARTERNTLTASITLNPDPRLPLIGTARPRLTRAEDDQGRSLLAEEKEGERFSAYSFYSQGNSQRQTSLTLRPPAPDAKTLSHLEGVVVYALVTKSEKWEIPDLLSKEQWTREFISGLHQLTATIGAAPAPGKVEGRIAVSVEVTSNLQVDDGEVPPPLLSAKPLLGALKIEDANGNILRNSGYNSSGSAGSGKVKVSTTAYLGDEYGYGSNKKPLALPLKLTFEAPLEVAQTEAPFSFENIVLP